VAHYDPWGLCAKHKGVRECWHILPAPANTAVETFAQSRNGACDPHQRRAYWLEARAGKSQKKGDLNFAYARIFVEREAVLGAFNYSEIRQSYERKPTQG